MLVGQQIGPFAIEKELGSGAMGTVYRARHMEKGVRVAIKIMAPGLGTSSNAQARFKREADILKQLKHPNIVRLYASGRFKNTPFYAMEYIEGESLDHLLIRRGRVTWEEVVTLGKQLCAGLQHAHEAGIIHRDLKPSNLMILPDGTVKLTDFGIAKDIDETGLTATNCTVGTASYMSPEQCRGEKNLTGKSDLYSMGIMFYELLTGRKPFQADSPMEVFMMHTSGTFERPSRIILDIPVWLDTLVCQLLEKKPEQRPFDASTVGQALERIKDKVEAQSSAGIEAAKARKIDRSSHHVKLDETDKEAARTLLGKKKKKKSTAFYRKGWFQGVAIGTLLLAAGFVFYLAFIKRPSAESLYQEASQLRAQDAKAARNGPIRQFLEYYPDDAKVDTVQGWADDYDRELRDKQLHARLNAGFKAEEAGEKLARQALSNENAGERDLAEETWNQLAQFKLKKPNDPERAWGLLPDKYLKQLQDIDELLGKLQSAAKEKAKNDDKKMSREEADALAAFRTEAKDVTEAVRLWNKLEERAKEDADLRKWRVLAALRAKQIKDKSAKATKTTK